VVQATSKTDSFYNEANVLLIDPSTNQSMSMPERLTIGEVAALVQLQTSTLRYYERIGILPKPRRVSGQRRYTHEILSLLAVIQLAKEANFSLPEIKVLLYGREGTPSERWRQIIVQKLDEVNTVIAREQARKVLLEEALESDALHYELDGVMPLLGAKSSKSAGESTTLD
jgi:MerR family transcriptional regulator, redox-sensitive transcriptional activator SoxR